MGFLHFTCLFLASSSSYSLLHLQRVAVIHGVFDEQILENAHGQLSDLRALLHSLGHFPQQQANQEVVAAVVLCQAELQTLL